MSPRLEVPETTTRHSLRVGERERTYWLAPAPAPAAPTLIVFHGLGMPTEGMIAWTGLAVRGPAAGFAAVFPDGVGELWDDRGSGRTDGVDDGAFVQALIGGLVDDGVADGRAIFLVGLSNGAFFAERLARAGIVAPRGIVLVAGTARQASRAAVPRPRAATAVLCFAGTADRSVPYHGGSSTSLLRWIRRRRVRQRLRDAGGHEVVGVETMVSDWVAVNGCASAPAVESVPGSELPVWRLSWRGRDCRPVVLYRIEGGGHGWPAGPQYLPKRMLGQIPRSLDATGILLSFAQDLLGDPG